MKHVGGVWIPDAEDHVAGHLLEIPSYADQYDDELVKLALALPRRRRAVDVGASFGLWSRRLAPAFDAVDAFEPLRDARLCFHKNVEARNVVMHPVALGDRERRARLVMVPANARHGATTFKTHLSKEEGDAYVQTLDEQGFGDVDFIKIDCEGFDYFVLLGAERTIKRSWPAIIFEAKLGVSQKRYGVSQRAPHELLESWGYVQRYEERGNHFYTKEVTP